RFDEHGTVLMSVRRPLLTFILGCASAVILVTHVIIRTESSLLGNIWWSAVGAVCAFVLVIITKIVQLALTDPDTTPTPPPFLIFPAYLIPWVEQRFDRIYCWSSPSSHVLKEKVNVLTQWPLRILRDAGQGYLVTLNPLPGVPLKLRS